MMVLDLRLSELSSCSREIVKSIEAIVCPPCKTVAPPYNWATGRQRCGTCSRPFSSALEIEPGP